ncbi:hypothetical protein [Hymenobacter daeguensis]
MGYTLRAFVGRADVLGLITDAYPEAVLVELGQDLCLIPLTEDLFDAVVKCVPSERIVPLGFLTAQLERQVVATIGERALGYLEAEYFGGHGEQAAVLWQGRRRLISGPGAGAINTVLEQLGVTPTARHDAFDAVGLGKHRHIEDWLPE